VLGEIRALECLGVIAFPNVRVALWIDFQIEPALLIENIRKPRIVTPIGFDDDGIVGLLGSQKVIDCVALTARIDRNG
jgi:hypothetical protein